MAIYAWKRYSLKPGYINLESNDTYWVSFNLLCDFFDGDRFPFSMCSKYYEEGQYLYLIEDLVPVNEYSKIGKDERILCSYEDFIHFNSNLPYVRYKDSSGRDDYTKLYKIVLMDGAILSKNTKIDVKVISRVASKVKDKSIDIVKSEASQKYPINGIQDNYWYEFIGKIADTKLKETGEYDIMRTNIKIGGGQ